MRGKAFEILQKIVFPKDEKLQMYWNLFYRAPRLSMNQDCNELYIPSGITVDFATYINGFSIQKWNLYTNLKSLFLSVKIQGKGIINVVGYHLNPKNPDRTVLSSINYETQDKTEFILNLPVNTTEQLYSLEIVSIDNSVLYDSSFNGSFEANDIRNINLCLATTTCHKEEFIKRNIQLLKEELLCESSEIRDNFFIHVVDNGRTLKKEEIEGFHVELHPNKNTGGSGGFARGMIESLHQIPEATNVLLMDDDVLVLPESIRRTFVLLSVLKDNWKNAFISGAMLNFEEMNIQHEDIGTVDVVGRYHPLKGERLDQSILNNVLKTNLEYTTTGKQYTAWWFCCIPVKIIKENGLPLPLFVRVDDIEYSLRCNPSIISMTGICLWHMGFVNKYNISMELYQTYRNQLIASYITRIAMGNVILKFKYVFFKHLLQFDYNGAELLCLAFEDFMKGPLFLVQRSGEDLLQEHCKYNEKMKPLSEFDVDVKLDLVNSKAPLFGFKKILFYSTINFQLFWPRFLLKKLPGIKCFDWHHQPAMQYRHESILAVNPYERTANLRIQDRKSCRRLIVRFCKDLTVYNFKKRRIAASYSAKREVFISEKFWKEYLEIN